MRSHCFFLRVPLAIENNNNNNNKNEENNNNNNNLNKNENNNIENNDLNKNENNNEENNFNKNEENNNKNNLNKKEKIIKIFKKIYQYIIIILFHSVDYWRKNIINEINQKGILKYLLGPHIGIP
jgi:hypothetical protein